MIIEKPQNERLKKYNINIKTKYKVNDCILERNTDNSKNDDIKNGIILEKNYYRNGIIVKREYDFDSRIQYSFVFNDEGNKDSVCPNCGMSGKIKDFSEGCPYCGTSYNLEYLDKVLGSKYYYDRIIKGKGYKVKTFIIDMVVSFIISLLFILGTSRTFYFFDILKVFIGAILIGLILFYIFYYLDAAILLPRIVKYKDKLNKKQMEFWNRMTKYEVNKNTFYNNLNYELRRYYYSEKNPNIIDYNIIDYTSLEEEILDNNLYVDVSLEIKIVEIKGDKLIDRIENDIFRLKRQKLNGVIKGGGNIIECNSCGAPIDVTNGECSYCKEAVNYFQEWVLV